MPAAKVLAINFLFPKCLPVFKPVLEAGSLKDRVFFVGCEFQHATTITTFFRRIIKIMTTGVAT
jgi:hypothetical protein